MKWELLTSDEFEELALSYAQFVYKDYTWKATKSKGDDNHDFYYRECDESNEEWEGWGEAKHSDNTQKIMSREKWDQTIISGQLANNVRHLMFVTNARISLEYIFRAECLKAPPYEKFEYINNCVLENWMYNNPQYIPEKLRPDFDYYPHKIKANYKVKIHLIDYFSDKKNMLKQPEKFYANKDYLLFFITDSNYETQLKLEFKPEKFIEILPYDIIDFNDIALPIGIRCWKCILRFADSGKHTLIFNITDKIRTKSKTIKRIFSVSDSFEPKIVYSQQMELLEKILDKLKTPFQGNKLFTIYAAKGTGKTHLLRMLYKEYQLYNQLSFLSFSYDEAECAKVICIIFLTANFGIDFWDLKCWKKILHLYRKYSEDNKKLTIQELQNIYKGATREDSAASIVGCQIVEKFVLKDSFQLVNIGFKKYITFIFDDIHKMPPKYGEILSIFIENYCSNSTNGKILLATREYEIKCNKLSDILINFSQQTYHLFPPTLTEKMDSLQHNFPVFKNKDYYLPVLKKCHSTMLFCILLRRIKTTLEKTGDDETKLQMIFAQIALQVIESNESLDFQEFMTYEEYFSVIFLVYAYDTGINIRFFEEIGLLDETNFLVKVGLFEEQGSFIFPSHDVYVDVFRRISRSNLFENKREKAASILYKHIENQYIDKFRALPVLLILNPKNDTKYLDESIFLLNSYYQSTEYGKMNLLCEQVIQKKYPIIENGIWDYDKLWLCYIYADCLDHCGSLQKSKKYFNIIFDNGFSMMQDDSLDFLWDAKAQIFNIKFALLDTDGLTKEINAFLIENYYKINLTHTSKFETAYLNALNRRMVISLLLDDYNTSKFLAKFYWKLSNKLVNQSHMAYIYIDYARGIYHINPKKALSLMREANKRFNKINFEKRRLIDSKSEMLYLECILEGKEPKYLDDCSQEIRDEGYIHMYVHTLLKRSAIRIYRREISIAQNLLQKVSDIIDLGQFPRSKLLFCNLMSAIYFIKKDYQMARRYIAYQNKLAETIGSSYKNLCKIDIVKRVDFNFRSGDNYFPLETRLW